MSGLFEVVRQAWHRRSRSGSRDPRHRTGVRAERAAARYLKRQGYRILARNLRTRLGEIDIVARHEGWLVVVEVRSRQADAQVTPRDTLTRKKRQKLIKLTEQLRKQHRLERLPVRVDLVEVALDERGRVKSCEVLRGLALGER